MRGFVGREKGDEKGMQVGNPGEGAKKICDQVHYRCSQEEFDTVS